MKPVTYKPNPDCEGGMEVHRYGKYISEAEYNELKKQVERLTKAGDAFEKEFDYLTESMRMLDNEKALLKKLFSKWRTAKKSTQ